MQLNFYFVASGNRRCPSLFTGGRIMFRFVLNQWRRQRENSFWRSSVRSSSALDSVWCSTWPIQVRVRSSRRYKEMVVSVWYRRSTEGSQMSTESNDLLEPNYLNSITVVFLSHSMKNQTDRGCGHCRASSGDRICQYRSNHQRSDDSSESPWVLSHFSHGVQWFRIEEEKLFTTNIHAIKSDVSSELRIQNLDNFFVEDINPSKMAMIVAIDPEQEARLVGLDKSVKKSPTSVISKRRTKQIRHLMSLTVLRYRSSSIRILQMRDIPTLKSNGLIYHLKRNNNRRRRSTASNSNQNYRLFRTIKSKHSKRNVFPQNV